MIVINENTTLSGFFIDRNATIVDIYGNEQEKKLIDNCYTFSGVPVAQILMYTFSGIQPDMEVAHIDGDLLNDKLSNLTYIKREKTKSKNTKRKVKRNKKVK